MLMEERLAEVNAISNDSQHRLGETSEVLKGLEDKLKASEVSFGYNKGPTGSWTPCISLYDNSSQNDH